MKRMLFISILFAVAQTAMAQDVLVTESGDAIKAWGVDVGGTKIYYRASEASDAPLQSIEKSAVLVWKKADGTRVVIGQEEKKVDTPAASSKPAAVSLTADDPVANAACIEAFNQTDVYSRKKPSGSAATTIVGLLHMSPDSKMADKNVEITYSIYKTSAVQKMAPRTSGIGVNVKNKTDKTIYIYLGNTFFLRHGISTPFTQSQASQSTSGGNNGATSTGFSQNVIAVPAQSALDLGKQEFFPTDGKNPFGGNITNEMRDTYTGGGLFVPAVKTGTANYFYWTEPKSNMLKKGEVRELSPGESPIDFGFKLTYSFSEDNTQLYHLDAKLYVSKIIGSSFNAWTGSDNIEFKGQPVYFMITQLQTK